ncbi:MAG: NUDIX domain-containing protein [Thaumarchaeota archaeon]|nr:NUDIX domain-containing protein [Nitrososphaerota archaeon]
MGGEEAVDVVDEHDSVVGSSTVGECLEKGLLHRAVAIVVVRKNGGVILQERSKHDLWHPGKWTLSCTGHVKAGERYEDAARRELQEELGLDSRLDLVKRYLLPPIREGPLTEREWVSLYTTTTDSQVVIDPVELESVDEYDGPRLQRMLDGDKMTPDAIILLREYLRLRSRIS